MSDEPPVDPKRLLANLVLRFAMDVVMDPRYDHRDITINTRIKLTRQKIRDDLQLLADKMLKEDLVDKVLAQFGVKEKM